MSEKRSHTHQLNGETRSTRGMTAQSAPIPSVPAVYHHGVPVDSASDNASVPPSSVRGAGVGSNVSGQPRSPVTLSKRIN
jgi:hypothetical protein